MTSSPDVPPPDNYSKHALRYSQEHCWTTFRAPAAEVDRIRHEWRGLGRTRAHRGRDRANSVELGQTESAIGPISAELAQELPSPGNLAETGTRSTKFGPLRPNSVCSWADFSRTCSCLAESRHVVAEVLPNSAEIAQIWPNPGPNRPHSSKSPDPGLRTRPNPAPGDTPRAAGAVTSACVVHLSRGCITTCCTEVHEK